MDVGRCATVILICTFSLLLVFFSLSKHRGNATDLLNATKTDYNLTDGKNGAVIFCHNQTLEAGEYELTNGTLFVNKLNMTLDASSYHVTNDSVSICVPSVMVHDHEVDRPVVSCYTANGVLLSLVTLLAILHVFWYIWDYKHLLYWSLSMIAFLLFTIFWLIAIGNAAKLDKVTAKNNLMYTLPTIIHITLLISVSWMSIFSSAVFFTASGRRTLMKVNGRIRIADWSFFHRRIILLIIFVSFFIILANQLFIKPYAPDTDPFCSDILSKPSVAYFGGVVLVFMVFNLEAAALSILEHRKLAKHPGFEYYPPGLGKSFPVFMCLSLLLYLTWGIGALASVSYLEWLWNVFVILTTMECILIFCLIHYLDVQSYIHDAVTAALRRNSGIQRKSNSTKATENAFEKCNEAVKRKKNKIVKTKYSSRTGRTQRTVYCGVLIPQSEVKEIHIQEV